MHMIKFIKILIRRIVGIFKKKKKPDPDDVYPLW